MDLVSVAPSNCPGCGSCDVRSVHMAVERECRGCARRFTPPAATSFEPPWTSSVVVDDYAWLEAASGAAVTADTTPVPRRPSSPPPMPYDGDASYEPPAVSSALEMPYV